jgi:putative exporter of polyketide antibiotics
MDQIIFVTYILSILSVLLSAVAVWLVFKSDEKIDKNVQVLQNQISTIRDSYTENKNGRR